jgi:uncharacterized membrane protein
MFELFGHFHPVLVHLPIGILLMACVFQLLATNKKYAALSIAVNISLFWGAITAIVTCITGYLLSDSGEYDGTIVSQHQWLGIAVALMATAFYFLRKKGITIGKKWLMPVLIIVLITITGHLGGTLTHGEGYLTNAEKETGTVAEITPKPIPNVQEAIAYTDIIQPLLQNKCYNCHGANKQKGKLRMDQTDLLMKGGKSGVDLIPGNVDKSELMKRILLAREDEHHMPPKEKSQLNEKDIALLHWWVSTGASFTKKTKELEQPEKLKPILLSLQHAVIEKKIQLNVPSGTIEPADAAAVKKLTDKGVVITPVAAKSNWLLANFVTAASLTDKDLRDLLAIKKQLVWLKLSNAKITDLGVASIGQCSNLCKLDLDNTGISNKGLESLANLAQLQVLNLVGTKINEQGLLALKHLKQLQRIFLFQTQVNKSLWASLKKSFPNTQLDSGGYKVPLLDTDTMLVKAPKTQ